MSSKPDSSFAAVRSDQTGSRFATLAFERDVAASLSVLWQSWTAPAARAVWASPAAAVTVEFLEDETRVGGRDISLCKVDGQPDTRCECGWLELQPEARSVNYEVVSIGGVTQSAALVTADFSGGGKRSRLAVTVQLTSSAVSMEEGYQQGFDASCAISQRLRSEPWCCNGRYRPLGPLSGTPG